MFGVIIDASYGFWNHVLPAPPPPPPPPPAAAAAYFKCSSEVYSLTTS
jgi:hypothetical protein